MLGREDMKKEAMPFSNKEENMGEIPVVRHEAPANGIDYITLMFECNDIAEEEVPYLGLLRAVLGYVNTRSYSYADLKFNSHRIVILQIRIHADPTGNSTGININGICKIGITVGSEESRCDGC